MGSFVTGLIGSVCDHPSPARGYPVTVVDAAGAAGALSVASKHNEIRITRS